MLVFSVFGWLGYTLAKKRSKKGFAALFATLVLFAFLSAVYIYHDDYLQTLPLVVQRESAYLLWLGIGALVALYSGYTLLDKKLLSLSAVIVFLPLFVFYTQPIYTSIPPKDPSKKQTYQTTLYSCACASLSTLLKHFGIPVSERLACKVTDTTRDGTNAGQLRYALSYFHFRFTTLHKKKRLEELTPPALLFVDRREGYENHTVVLFKKERNNYTIFDPMEGWQRLNGAMLGSIWHGNGIEIKGE